MNINRTPDEDCLLCVSNKADKKGSHFTPAGIIKHVIGERDYEEIYNISADKATTSTYFGRSNLLNTDPRIRKPEHTADYVFCTKCEEMLGKIESECNHPLIQLTKELTQGNLTINRTANGNKFHLVAKPKKNVLLLFIYSIIWRQCLHHHLESDSYVISKDFEESLRLIIHKHIYLTRNEIETSPEFVKYPKIILLTTYHKGDQTRNFINPNTISSNPELFFIGPYNALIFHSDFPSQTFKVNTGINDLIIDEELIINTCAANPIGVINEQTWENVTKTLVKREADKFIDSMTNMLLKKNGMTYEYSRTKLLITAQQLSATYRNDYIWCLRMAFQNLMQS